MTNDKRNINLKSLCIHVIVHNTINFCIKEDLNIVRGIRKNDPDYMTEIETQFKMMFYCSPEYNFKWDAGVLKV